jgi:hypothetical protein
MSEDVNDKGEWEVYVGEPGDCNLMILVPGTNRWDNAQTVTVPDTKPLEGVVIKIPKTPN